MEVARKSCEVCSVVLSLFAQVFLFLNRVMRSRRGVDNY